MSILMVLIGATIGAAIGSLFMHWRNDVAKERQQLESKTPYDYALTNARADNNRYRDELVTIKALKRTEADTERIRNEIGTILSDDGEEATESVYEPNIGMPIQDNGDGTFSPITWDNRISSGEMAEIFGYRGHPIIVNPTADGREYMDNVREDDTKDEPLAYMSAERMYTNLLNKTGSKPRIVSVFWVNEAEDGRYWHHTSGELNGSAWTNEGLKHVTVDNECIDGDKVDLITGGDDISGETLYRKGNR